jgi:hypothetical protein
MTLASKQKGQASIEFLVSYGWAILLLAIVVGFILFSGVFDTNRYVSESCFLGPDFLCYGEIIKEPYSSTLLLNITNLNSYPIKLQSINITCDEKGVKTKRMLFQIVQPHESTIIRINKVDLGNVGRGEVVNLDVSLEYYICPKDLNPTCLQKEEMKGMSSGKLITKVLKK